jgi:hypothetical protein
MAIRTRPACPNPGLKSALPKSRRKQLNEMEPHSALLPVRNEVALDAFAARSHRSDCSCISLVIGFIFGKVAFGSTATSPSDGPRKASVVCR